MALDMVAVLRRLGVSIDTNSPPLTAPGVISWFGRLIDVTPELITELSLTIIHPTDGLDLVLPKLFSARLNAKFKKKL